MNLSTMPSTHYLKKVAKVIINHRDQRRALLRQELFDLVARVSPILAVDSAGTRYYVSTRDRGLGRELFAKETYEQDLMRHAIALAEKHVGRAPLLEGRTFVDIGANIGTSTIPALKLFGAAEAVSIEPNADNYKLLRCNLIANDLEDRARTLPVALSDHTGTGVLELAGDWSDHRVRTGPLAPDGAFQEANRSTVGVRLMTFDDLLGEAALELTSVGMVWMDVQGHEGHVLAGATSLVASEIPVAIEYWPYGLRRANGLDMLHDLVAAAYRTVIDVRASLTGRGPAQLPAGEVHTLAGRYGAETYTDLLLLK